METLVEDLSLIADLPETRSAVEGHKSIFSIIHEMDRGVTAYMVKLLQQPKKRDYYLITPHAKPGLEHAWLAAYPPVPFGSPVMFSPGCTAEELPMCIDMIPKQDRHYRDTAEAVRKVNEWYNERHHSWERYAENLASAFRKYAKADIEHFHYLKSGKKLSITPANR